MNIKGQTRKNSAVARRTPDAIIFGSLDGSWVFGK
jgi:hypothetical protein